MMETKSILLVGVGGQGTILASRVLTVGLMEAGYDVKMSEIHGMSQRGGSVSSQVRYGDHVDSPVVEKGMADVIVAFEQMEALRSLDYLKKDGVLVVNNKKIDSMSVIVGDEEYPDDVLEEIGKHVQLKAVDADRIARGLGNVKASNVVLLGTVVASMGLDNIDWDEIIAGNVKPKFVELNQKSLHAGMEAVS